MTEQDYILLTNRIRISNAISELKMATANADGIFNSDKKRDLLLELSNLEEQYFDKIDEAVK